MDIQEKILSAINTGNLSIKNEGEKKWYNYKLRITKLFWNRNLFDGHLIEIYDFKTNIHLSTIKL
ncbi:hypothetical protein [Tenacibaculum aestuariivivum]|uniref:hypothetical protein n=1 Tax=Tenacibaculum aestuariivivum TaxID=2006131 RepID=UPI003AB36288